MLGDYNIIQKGAYQTTFGAYPDGTCYTDVAGKRGIKVDERKGFLGTAVKKAVARYSEQKNAFTTGTGGAGTTDRVMVPIYVDDRIVDISRKFTPLVELIPRVTNQGLTADYNRITEKRGAFAAPEDATLPSDDDEVERESARIKYLYAVGRVTGQAQASVPNFMMEAFEPTGGAFYGDVWSDRQGQNATQTAVLFKARRLKEFEEDLVINGDSANNPYEFDGIIKQQGNTNEVDKGGEDIEIKDIDDAIEKAFSKGGRPTIGVASSKALVQLRDKMRTEHLNIFNMGVEEELGFGIPDSLSIHTMIGRVALFPSMFLDNSDDNKSVYFLDLNFVEMRVLLVMTYETLAKTNDSEKFMLKMYEVLVMRAPEFNACITNID